MNLRHPFVRKMGLPIDPLASIRPSGSGRIAYAFLPSSDGDEWRKNLRWPFTGITGSLIDPPVSIRPSG